MLRTHRTLFFTPRIPFCPIKYTVVHAIRVDTCCPFLQSRSHYFMSSELLVSKNIPLPPPKASSKYPLRTLAIGDSFAVHRDEVKAVGSALAALRQHQKKYSYPRINLVQRAEPGTEMTRFWRSE